MVYELAEFTAAPGHEHDLEDGLRAAMQHFQSATGCLGISLRRCVEDPTVFLYVIEWESLAAHTEGFRGSPAFAAYRALIAGHFVEPVRARHFSAVA